MGTVPAYLRRLLKVNLEAAAQRGDQGGGGLLLAEFGRKAEEHGDFKAAIFWHGHAKAILSRIGSPDVHVPKCALEGIRDKLGALEFDRLVREIEDELQAE